MWYQERNGRYRFFENFYDPIAQKTRTATITLDRNTSQSRKKAQKMLSEKIELLLAGKKINALTFCDLKEQYLQYIKPRVKSQTYDSKKSRLASWEKVIGRGFDMKKLTAIKIDEKLQKTGWSAKRKNGMIKPLKPVIHWAVTNHLLPDADCVDNFTPYKEEETKEVITDKYLTAEELNTLISHESDETISSLIAFLGLSGLRIDEARAIMAEDIDLEKRTLKVTKQLEQQSSKVIPPKTDTSYRTITIQDELVPVLSKLLSNHPHGYLFTKKGTSKPLSYNSLLGKIKAVAKDAGIEKKVTPHILRHTHASLLYENLVDKDIIARRLGHAPGQEDKVTLRIYTHITQTRMEREKDIIMPIKLLS